MQEIRTGCQGWSEASGAGGCPGKNVDTPRETKAGPLLTHCPPTRPSGFTLRSCDWWGREIRRLSPGPKESPHWLPYLDPTTSKSMWGFENLEVTSDLPKAPQECNKSWLNSRANSGFPFTEGNIQVPPGHITRFYCLYSILSLPEVLIVICLLVY